MRLLIVIDMQNDFLDGALRNEEGIKIIPRVVNKINEYINNGDTVVATRDTHNDNYLDTQEGRRLPVPHCIKDTEGWEINSLVSEALGNSLKFDKDGFGSPELAAYLAEEYGDEPDLEIELVGVCTDICVISNAMLIKAALREARVIVDASATAGVTLESHSCALNAMRACQIDIIGE